MSNLKKPNGLCPSDENPMTKSIATASINRETAVALIDAALAAARAIGIPAAVAVVDATEVQWSLVSRCRRGHALWRGAHGL